MPVLANLLDHLSSLVLGAVGAVIGLIAFVFLAMAWFKWKFHKIVHEAVLEAGSALKGAETKVHAVTAVPAPADTDAKKVDA